MYCICTGRGVVSRGNWFEEVLKPEEKPAILHFTWGRQLSRIWMLASEYLGTLLSGHPLPTSLNAVTPSSVPYVNVAKEL